MNDTKTLLGSKIAWTGIVLILFNLLAALGVLPEGLTEEMVTNAVNAVLAVAIILFRKNSTAQIVPASEIRK